MSRNRNTSPPDRLPGWAAFWIAVVFGLLGMLSASLLPPSPRAGQGASPRVPPTGGAGLRMRQMR
jgi:hypothetical protein